MTYTIRNLNTYTEMMTLLSLQREIWQFHEADVGLYPPTVLVAAKNGGIVLGAFAAETDEMVAFLFSFLGRAPGGPLKLCSQTMGVKPAWRGRGIAEALKQTQREQALAQKLPLITWTYDPLEAPNAHLNLFKLRAISRTYWRDVYGSNFGTLNQGLPTDRLLVEWWLAGERLADEPEIDWDVVDKAEAIFETSGSGLTHRVVRANLALDAETLLLEIPAELQPLKAANLDLALDWRMKVRKAFETYLARGYLVTDFVSITARNGERRNRYLLQKSTPTLLAHLGIEA